MIPLKIMEKELLETKGKSLLDLAKTFPLEGNEINPARYESLKKNSKISMSEYCTPSTDCNCDCYCDYDCNDCE